MSAIIVLNENKCVGCNKCIAHCPVEGANVAYLKDGQNKVRTNSHKCILCGKCIAVCDHGARDYYDGTDAFFDALAQGEKISVIAAPSIRFNFDKYKKLFGFLKSRGVNHIYDASFGADIATWGYLKAIKEQDLKSVIAQPCPPIVSYIEKHCPELIEKLSPVQSPALCTAIYMRKHKNISDKLAFISPCLSKTQEFADTDNVVSYNVTYNKLTQYMAKQKLRCDMQVEMDFDSEECGLGLTFSRPGGLSENIHYHTKGQAWVRQIEGIDKVYDYLEEYAKRKKDGKKLPLILDILNCSHGCNIGNATCQTACVDDVDEKMQWLKEEKLKNAEKEKFGRIVYSLFEKFDKELDWRDFVRRYEDKSDSPKEQRFLPIEYDAVYKTLYKNDQASRNVNCISCGYGNCRDFATAILKGDNHPGNCIRYNSAMTNEERQKKEENFRIAIENANIANRAKSEFLANMSHELRTPLNSILGMNKLLQGMNLSEDQKGLIDVMYRSSVNLLDLVNDILDLSKIEAGKMSLERIGFDPAYVLDGVIHAMNPLADEKLLRIVTHYNEGDFPYVLGDPARLLRILMNLVGNAVKYTEKGRVDIAASSRRLDDIRVELRFEVTDTGIGISEEKQKGIFEKFVQADTSTTRKYGGTGLGLAITKELVELMGGIIGVRSKEDVGSTFWFAIPFEITDKLHEQKYMRAQKMLLGTILPQKANILVAEDHPLNQILVRKLLQKFGIGHFKIVENGQEVVDVWKQESWDVILMDCHMPKKSGYDATEEIRQLEKETGAHTPVVAMTANAMIGDREKCLRCGMDEYISKPINFDELQKILGQWIHLASAPEEAIS